jgi:hypothetical protein
MQRMTWSDLRHITRQDSYSSKPINERFYYILLRALAACMLDDASKQSIDGTKSTGIFVMQQAKSRYFINKIHNFIYLRLHSSTPFCFHVRRGGSRIVHATPAPPPRAVDSVRLRYDSTHPEPLAFARPMCSDHVRPSSDHVRPGNQPRRLSSPASRSSSLASTRLTSTTCRTDSRKERRYNNNDHHHHDWSESSRAKQFQHHRPDFCPKISTLSIIVFNIISSDHSNVFT